MKIRQNVGRCKDPHNSWEYGSFTIKKEMVFSSVKKLEKVVGNLKRLSWERFYNIVIPEFEYKVDDHILEIEMEYIKGDYMQSIHHHNVVYDELVARDGDWSWTDYSPRNFIVKDDRIHVIDLDSYGYIEFEDRQKKWDQTYGIFAPLIRSYRGKNQIDAKLSCSDLDYLRLRKLLVCVFNAKVERVEEKYYAKIENSTYDNLEELMVHLRLVYNCIKNAMDLNPPNHQQRKNILKELRETSSYKATHVL